MVMLSRVADHLYWVSRYLERAEHTARLIDVNLNLILGQSQAFAELSWTRVLKGLHAPPYIGETQDAYRITQAMTFEMENPISIVSSIAAARANLRQVREQVSSEMWEQLNRLSLQLKSTSMEDVWEAGPHDFFRSVREGAHLFQGITDSTMSHGEGWYFLQAGRYIERASATTTLLDVYFGEFLNIQGHDSGAGIYLELLGLLKSCTAFEAYCKVYTADLRPERIAEFLLLNAEFPRSVRFAADRMQSALQAIGEATGARKAGRVNRLAGRLRAMLNFGQIDEVMETGWHQYLKEIHNHCAQIHAALQQTFVAYPIEAALAS